MSAAEEAAVFFIGNCTVQKSLRMEDASKSLPAEKEVMIAMQTKHTRDSDESCAICYYDSTEEADDGAEEIEKELSRKTVFPVGRYSSLCICENMEHEADATIATADTTEVCSHIFHTGCLYKWVKSETGGFSCPICRGGLEKQRISGIPDLYATAPEYVVEYWPNGKVKSEHFELNGVKSGLFRSFTQNGTKESESTYENGTKTGIETFFYPESQTVRSTTEYLADQKHGKCRRFATDGKLIGESNWKEGKRNGRNVEFYTDSLAESSSLSDDRQMSNLEHYIDGEKHGIFMKWAITGKLLMYGAYKNGQRDGRFAAWFEDTGALRLKEFFVDGVQEGRSIEYHAIEERFKHDSTKWKHNIKEVCFYSHGLKVGVFESFWRDGTKRVRAEYNDIGQLDGKYLEWNRFGQLTKEFCYDGGELDGICQTFVSDGSIDETTSYRMGKMHGLYIQRYKMAGNHPKLVRLFKDGEELYSKCFTRQGTVVWENRNVPPPKDAIAVPRPPSSHRGTKTRFI